MYLNASILVLVLENGSQSSGEMKKVLLWMEDTQLTTFKCQEEFGKGVN